jgi:hypothetical protein
MLNKMLRRAALLTLVLILPLDSCARASRPTDPGVKPRTPVLASKVPAPIFPFSPEIRAAYFYDYMSTFHLDSLAATGFNRAVIKWIGDSLGTREAGEMRGWMNRGVRVGVEVAPSWALQSRARLAALPTTRRYTWGIGTVEPNVGCPLDSLFWRSTLLDRANEMLGVTPGVNRLAVDLEIYTGSRHHYDAGPCLCAGCWSEYLRAPRPRPAIASFEEARLGRLLASLIGEFARGHPGVELGVFDLDFDSFVHRAMARALVSARVPTTDYTERTYSTGGSSAPQARAVLASLGVQAPLVGGLWLKRFTPGQLPGAIQSVLDQADGYFVFTTFSLWVEPSKLTGGYALQGTQAEYWAALRSANQ